MSGTFFLFRRTKAAVLKTKVKVVVVATDKNPMLKELQEHLDKYKVGGGLAWFIQTENNNKQTLKYREIKFFSAETHFLLNLKIIYIQMFFSSGVANIQ